MTDYLEQGLVTFVTGDATVAGLIGSRMYPQVIPQSKSLPAIRYQVITEARSKTLDGPTGRVRPRIQIDCVADNYSTVKQLARAVRQLLNGHRGDMGGVKVGAVTLETSRDDYDSKSRSQIVSMDFFIAHKET